MDYARIYNELIEHRKMMPKVEDEVYEEHHIIPKSRGGTNDPENLINLTLADHFVAHLLLAHIYGGSLWYAAQLMGATREIEGVRNRRTYAIARRKLRETMGKHVMDHTVYEFKDIKTGEIIKATQLQLQQEQGLRPSSTSALVTGASKHAQGFCLASTDVEVKLLDPVKYAFRHIETGTVYHMTRKEFTDTFNLDRSVAHKIVEGRQKHSSGFCLDCVTDFGGVKGTGEKLEFKDVKTGEVLVKSCREMVELYGGCQTEWRAAAKGFGVVRHGFCSASTPLDHPAIINPRNSQYILRNTVSGELVSGTMQELAIICGAHKSNVAKVLVGRNKTCKGYEFVGIAPPGGGAAFITERHAPLKSSRGPLQDQV
jgi:hypothetical protein